MPEFGKQFKCPKCKLTKDISCFYRNSSRDSGIDCWCKLCQLEAQSRRNNQNKEIKRQKRKVKVNIICAMLSSAKRRAMLKNLPFEIVAQDIMIPDYCPILGIPLQVNDGYASENSPSLDRIDVKKGYISGNVAVISSRANRLKNDATLEEVQAILEYMQIHIEEN